MVSLCTVKNLLVISIWTIIFFVVQVQSNLNSEQLVSNDFLFNLNLPEAEEALYHDVGHSRVRRDDVDNIRHLYDEERVYPHSQEEKDEILNLHREYRSLAGASNMEYMVRDNYNYSFCSNTIYFVCLCNYLCNIYCILVA